MPLVEKRTANRKIAFKLTETELVQHALKAAGLRPEIDKLEADKKAIGAEFKKKIDEKDAELRAILSVIQTGTEERAVEVEERLNYEDCVVQVWHLGEMMSERPMTNEERQVSIHAVRNDPQGDLFDGDVVQGGDVVPFNPPRRLPFEVQSNFVQLDDIDPSLPMQEQYVQAEDDKPTVVKHQAIMWKLEPGEAARFERREVEIHGSPMFAWEKVSASHLGAPSVEAPQPQEPAAPAEESF